MAISYSRGYEIYYDWETESWKYTDNNEIISDSRSCKRCGCKPTPEGYDACLGHIEGVTSACCSHGVEEKFIVYK